MRDPGRTHLPKLLHLLPDQWVACDWGALRSTSKTWRLPPQMVAVLCDHTFLEPITSKAGPHRSIAKLRSVLASPGFSARLLVARSVGEILQRELDAPDALPSRTSVISPELTVAVRDRVSDETLWSRDINTAKESPSFFAQARMKDDFVTNGDRFVQALRDNQPAVAAMLHGDPSARCRYVRQRDLPIRFLDPNISGHPWVGALWQRALRAFPDRTAVGRWIRLTAYYALERVAKPEQARERYSNNYEDAHYAFLASFVGCMATRDSGLRECLSVVLPHVAIVDLDPLSV